MRLIDVFLSIVAGLLGYPFFMVLTVLVDSTIGERSFYWEVLYSSGSDLANELQQDWLSTLPTFMIISVLMMLIYSFFRDDPQLARFGVWALNSLIMIYLFFMGLSFFVLLFSFFTLLLFTYANSLFKSTL